MEGDEIKRRPGGRSARVRRAVFDSTIAIIGEAGIEALTVPAVAKRASVHETSIYRRWGSRDTLMIEALLDHSQALIPAPDSGDVRADLIEFGDEIVRFLSNPLGTALLRTMINAAAGNDVEAAHEYWSARYTSAMVIVERGIARGEIRSDSDPRIIVEMVVAPLHLRALVGLVPLAADLPRQLVDAALDGVRV
jgi:AcrR family transcriptional regulator